MAQTTNYWVSEISPNSLSSSFESEFVWHKFYHGDTVPTVTINTVKKIAEKLLLQYREKHLFYHDTLLQSTRHWFERKKRISLVIIENCWTQCKNDWSRTQQQIKLLLRIQQSTTQCEPVWKLYLVFQIQCQQNQHL